MSHPPDRARRRRIRRGLGLVAAGALLLAAGGGYAYWRGSRFPARSERLRGTPIELRVQEGVSGRELAAVRGGLRIMDRFMTRTLGYTVRGPVEARVARHNGCRPFQASGGALLGEGDRGFLCVDTASPAWQWLVLRDFVSATSISAHEYVHVMQAELGCLPDPDRQRYRWIVEGMANHLAWRALAAAGRATPARVRRTVRESGAFSPGLGPLRSYERDGGRDQEYALWQFAVGMLVRDAVADGAASATRPDRSLVRFCRLVGSGRSWRRAFADSFGLSPQRFYVRFEAARKRHRVSY